MNSTTDRFLMNCLPFMFNVLFCFVFLLFFSCCFRSFVRSLYHVFYYVPVHPFYIDHFEDAVFGLINNMLSHRNPILNIWIHMPENLSSFSIIMKMSMSECVYVCMNTSMVGGVGDTFSDREFYWYGRWHFISFIWCSNNHKFVSLFMCTLGHHQLSTLNSQLHIHNVKRIG